jgi:putative iron-dependent peroxidase
MPHYQSGVVADAKPAALFLTFNQTRNEGAAEKVKALLAKTPAMAEQFNQRYADAGLHLVSAIGSAYWDQLALNPRPALLQPFPSFEQGEMVAPNTPVDLLFHIRSERKDLNFLLAQELIAGLGDAAALVEEIDCFRYLDSRDLTGFVDGTENPQGEQRVEVAVVGAEDAYFTGGSYIHLQRYVHNLPHWQKQSLKTQEDTIGRTKVENIEYPSAEKALTAHTKRTSLKDEQGESIEILRHSMPYGDTQECGLLFASYCRTPENFTLMLRSMIEGDGQGHRDHLLKYTRAVTGQAFFAPSV